MAFTPGPWEAHGKYVFKFPAHDRQITIVEVAYPYACGTTSQIIKATSENHANARLIAAAPDMHAGLESAYQLLARLGESGDLSVVDTAAVLIEAIRIREILSKAVT